MDIDTAHAIIDGYANWWRDGIEVYQEGASIRLICPMLDRHNDHMSIYIADDQATGGFLLTDIGSTICDLSASGCDVLSSEARKSKLDAVVRGFGIAREGEELYVKTGMDHLFQSMNMLMQSMASVDDFFFTVKDSVKNLFIDDIATWLDDNEIRFMQDVKVSGRSGFESKFDFVIPKSGSIAPERYIKAVGMPSETSVKNALFGWNDIKIARPGDATEYIFMNSLNSKSRIVDSSLKSACESYGVKPVVWDGSADSVLGELVA